MERSINKVLNSFQYSIPLAHFICFVPEKSKNSIIVSILKKFKIEIIIIPNSNEHITNRRFIESYKYLKKNKKLYERVMHIDIDDVFIFGDIFSTIGTNDLIVNYNCNNESINLLNCKKFFDSVNKYWFKQDMNKNNTNRTEVVKFKKKKPITIIARVIIGGINI